MYNTVWNLLHKWISKSRLQQHKNHSKTSHGVGKFAQNLHASKRLWYNERNCKSVRHSQRHTLMHCKSQNRTTTTNMPNLRLEIKARTKEYIKLPSPCRHNQMICAINHYQDINRQEPTDVKQPFCLMMSWTYVMIPY